MTHRHTMAELIAQADATLADNTTGDISAADVRDMVKEIILSLQPGYGVASIDSLTLVALGVTPVVVTYDTIAAVTPEDFLVIPAAGQIQRLAGMLPTTVTRVTFLANIAAPDGNELVFSIFRDGIDVPGGTTASARGIGNLVEASFQMINSQPIPGDPVYEVRVAKISGGVDDVVLSDVRFILEVVPSLG